jgi:hypothetical protein
MVITLSSELEAALNEQARRQGVAPEVLALEVLRGRFLAPVRPDESRNEWERQLRRVATDCDVSMSDGVLGGEGRYE